MKKQLILGLVVITAGVIFAGCSLQKNSSAPEEKNTTSVSPSPEAATVKEFTLADIEQHAVASDCWMALEGKVYDVTKYIAGALHPGKDAILKGCGKDATEMFNNRPNGSGAHSAMARTFLGRFEIGVLKN